MVNFFPGKNREFFANRAGYHAGKSSGQFYGGPANLPQGGGHHFGKSSGQYYGGPINPAGAGLAAPLSPPPQNGPGMGGSLPPFGGTAERPGVYGNPGQYQPMPPNQYNLPGGPRGNGIPGMNQPDTGGPLPPYQGEGVSGLDPNGMGTGVNGNPFTPDPNNITMGGGSMGGNAFAGRRPWGNRPLLSNSRGL